MELADKLDTDEYIVTHYVNRGSNKVIVAFASAGAAAPGGTIEEFKGTLAQLGVAAIFVLDKPREWYNHSSTPEVFNAIAELTNKYSYVGAMGESMGACGAILFSNFCGRVSRILAFAPQFSIMHPYIGFDHRYAEKGGSLARHFYYDFSSTPQKRKIIQLIFGDTDWRDFIHRSMFAAYDFSITTIAVAPHDVAQYLKFSPKGNKLADVVGYFCDFDKPYNKAGVMRALDGLVAEAPLRDGFGFRAEKEWADRLAAIADGSYPIRKIVPPALANLSLGKPALQSSVSQWSRHPTCERDAAGAVNGQITGNYAFHTAFERRAWWSVDLLSESPIGEIHIYNFLSDPTVAQRFARFEIQLAATLGDYRTVHRKNNDQPVGGADGNPYVWRAEMGCTARYVRIRLLGEGFLHLDQVEVYGISE